MKNVRNGQWFVSTNVLEIGCLIISVMVEGFWTCAISEGDVWRTRRERKFIQLTPSLCLQGCELFGEILPQRKFLAHRNQFGCVKRLRKLCRKIYGSWWSNWEDGVRSTLYHRFIEHPFPCTKIKDIFHDKPPLLICTPPKMASRWKV